MMAEKIDNSVLITFEQYEQYEKLKKFKLRAVDNFFTIEILVNRLFMLLDFIDSSVGEQDKIEGDILLTTEEIFEECKKYRKFINNYESLES